MVPATIPVPPAHDPGQWRIASRPPRFYHGSQFDFDTVERLVQPVSDDQLCILGKTLNVTDLMLVPPTSDPNHPIYFEITGHRYLYAISVWSDRIEIEVREVRGSTRLLSTMFPGTEEQLIAALRTIVMDCSMRRWA